MANLETCLASAIKSFDFSNYGMDKIADYEDDWISALALHIAKKCSCCIL